MLRFLASVVVALLNPLLAAYADDPPAPMDAKALAGLFDAGEFAEIERTENEARQSRTINSSGFWQLERFYTLMRNHLKRDTAASIDKTRAKIAPWAKAYPDSSVWRVVLASQLIDRGWQARGTGFASTVTASGRSQLETYLTEAWNLLQDAKEHEPGNPEIYAQLIVIANSLGGDPTQSSPSILSLVVRGVRDLLSGTTSTNSGVSIYESILIEGMGHEKLYPPLYQRYANVLLPRWHGEPGELESFAARSADATETELGDDLYARIAMSVLDSIWEGDYQADHAFEWTRVRAGLDRILTEYPNSEWFKTMATRLACAHKARDDAERYRAMIVTPANDVWPDPRRMEVMYDWIDGKGPYPSGGPLSDAVLEGDTYTVERLLSRGADPDAVGFTGVAPLVTAAGYHRMREARLLIDAGADPNSVTGRGNTPLRDASYKQDLQMMTFLLDSGADPNHRTGDGWVPITHCVKDNTPKSLDLLLKRGADVNGRNPDGWTALSLAVQLNNLSMVKYLLENGADPNTRFDAGASVLKLAKLRNDPQMLAVLEAAGATE